VNNRIYGEVVDIDADRVRSFYDQRSQKAAGDNPYASVLLNDRSPQSIQEQIKIETGVILPRLNINGQSRVLDIGCGIGRWAERLIPICARYYGIDFSPNMIDVARERAQSLHTENFQFENMSFQELVRSESQEQYNRVIISGVLTYISDRDIRQSLEALAKRLDQASILYIREPCGMGKRLTLKDFPSEALGDDYNAIYRTKEEYDNFFRIFTDNGYSVSFCAYYSALGGTVTYTDTDRIYYILER